MRPSEDRLQALRDYYVDDVDGAGDVEDLFAEVDALTRERDEAQTVIENMGFPGPLLRDARDRAEAAEQRVKALEEALERAKREQDSWQTQYQEQVKSHQRHVTAKNTEVKIVLARAEKAERALAEGDAALERMLRWLETGQVAEMDSYIEQPHRNSCRPWHSDGCRCGNETLQEIARAALRPSEEVSE